MAARALRAWRTLTLCLACAGMAAQLGCASTSGGSAGGGAGGFPVIPEGKGRLLIETGGINEVNYYVLNPDTDAEVYNETPRVSAASPRGYQWRTNPLPQFVDLPPGKYTVVVNTDIRDDIVLPDTEVIMGEQRYVRVPVGRFQLLYSDDNGRAQVPFLIYDYRMQTQLGRGMTSTEVRYFVVPEGEYKVRIENSRSGLDEIRPVQISFGRTQNITIAPAAVPAEEQSIEDAQQ